MKKSSLFFLLTLYFSIVQVYANQDDVQELVQDREPSWPEQVDLLHLSTFVDLGMEGWEEDNYQRYLAKIFSLRKKPKPYIKRRAATKVYACVDQDPQGILGSITTCKNLELVSGAHTRDNHLLKYIDRTKTEVGRVVLMHMITQPTADKATLHHRSQAISYLNENKALFYKLTSSLEKLAQSEAIVLGFWSEWDPFKTVMGRHLFADGKSSLNNQVWALEAKSWWDHQLRFTSTSMGCLATVILAYHGLALLSSNNNPHYPQWCNPERYAGHGGALSLLWGRGGRVLQGIVSLAASCYAATTVPESFSWMRACFDLEQYIQSLLVEVAKYMEGIKEIEQLLDNYSDSVDRFPMYRRMSVCRDLYGMISDDCQEFMRLIQESTFKEESLFASRGVILRTYYLVSKIKEELALIFSAIGQVDAYCSIVRLYQEHIGGRAQYCFVDFDDDQNNDSGPYIQAEGLWNPFINQDVAVPNDVQLGDGFRRNAIITGPNAGGKSTFLRSLGLAQILAQSICVAPASRYSSTPFHSIETYMNVTDDTAQGQSLFKAEVARAQELVEKMGMLESQGKYGLVLCDEMLSGTNPTEAEAAAYVATELLGSYSTTITVVATHFKLLTELEEKTNDFINWNVSVIKHDDGSIEYPFKLSYGPSNQHVAFDIMRIAGFQGSVIDEASQIINSK